MEDNAHNFMETEKSEKTSHTSKWRLFLFFFIICGLLFGIFVTIAKIQAMSVQETTIHEPASLEPKKPEGLLTRIKHFVFSKDTTLEGQRDDRINLLLMGMGGLGHDGPFLTDTIIIASLQPSTGQIAMVSIPRDLGVNIPGYGWHKINHANHYGEMNKSNWGGAFATEVIEKTFDINIHYYGRIDFTAFEQIIDEVGGLNIDVERSFTDYEYPAPNHLYQTVSFKKGVQLMEGETALQYARSRHGNNGEGSDFARARRQQKMILALKDKVISFETLANPIRIHNIMKTLDNHITTNMEFSDIISLMKMAKELDTANIKTLVLDNGPSGYLSSGYTQGGAYILRPVTGNFDDINHAIANIFEIELAQPAVQTPEQIAPAMTPASVEVLNGTWRAGLASRVRKVLVDANITVSTVGNTDERPQYESGIYAATDKEMLDVLNTIKNELDMPIKKSLPEGFTNTNNSDIVVILGEDFEE